MAPQEVPNSTYEMNNKIQNVEYTNDSSTVDSPGCCKRCTDKIILTLEDWFATLGRVIATYPIRTIVIVIVVSLLCVIGVLEFYDEKRQDKLWVSADSTALKHSDWVSERWPPQARREIVIGETTNVLTAQGMKAVCEVDSLVKDIKKNDTDANWGKICLSLDKDGKFCSPSTILTLWGNNCQVVKSLSTQQILARVNDPSALQLPNGGRINLNLFLGDISRDGSGKITGAKATKMTYFLKNQEVYVASKGARIDEKGEAWEKEFVKVFGNTNAGFNKMWTYSIVGQREDGGSAISDDLKFLFVGYVLIILYLSIMLGSFSKINHKIWLGLCGVVTIGLSIGITYGLSSAFQLFSTPVHSILPFLLLGIGVDDVFVIIQNWDNVGGPINKDRSIPENIALTMRSAGVSILVTSFTDICAFLIGATTILPALRSFCIWAGIGILAVFILTCTFYVALLSLDSKRQRGRRDACCCCIKLSDDWQPSECSKKSFLQEFMGGAYSKLILSIPGRVVFMLMWAGFLAGGAYGLSQLKQDFDPDWFLPDGSKTKEFNQVNDKYFSTEGIQSYVYVGQVDYFTQQKKLDELFTNIDDNKYIVKGSTRSWYQTFKIWLKTAKNASELNAQSLPKTSEDFHSFLYEFRDSSNVGRSFFNDVKNTSNGVITATRIQYKHIKLEDASSQVAAMDSLLETVQKTKFKEGFEAFGHTRTYIGWEINKVISEELIRNLVLAGVVVFLVTLFLIANVWVSLMVLSCVVFTLIDIAGFMHFWGLTVDTVTTIQLILAIGLSVDYSAHIGHGFMASRSGSRVERATNSLLEIGPAVVHGGTSTFLAFVCLSASTSYVFSTFFKLFFLVVIFGMFHGLVYLPIVLSLVGPAPYASSESVNNESQNAKKDLELNNDSKPAVITNGHTENKQGVDNASFVHATLSS